MTSTNHNKQGQIVKAVDGWTPKDRHGIPFKYGETIYQRWELGGYDGELEFEQFEVVGLHDNGALLIRDSKGEVVICPYLRMLSHFNREITRENFVVNILSYLEDIYDAMPDADKEVIDDILADANIFGYDPGRDPHHSLYPYSDEK